MQEGKYFKDGARNVMVHITYVKESVLMGRSYFVKRCRNTGKIQKKIIDSETMKVWFKQFHIWEPYDKEQVVTTG